MLTYMEVHLYYTLPVLFALGWIVRPFHSSQDQHKLIFLSSIAFGTASIWDNYIVYHRAWSYCPTCVTAVIGYVPLEEYMFFIIMTLMTVTFTNLVMRWRLPSFYLKPETSTFQSMFVRFLPIVTLLSIGAKAWILAVPNTPLFYGCCILWYVCPVLALLWYGAGEYMCRRWQSVLVSILIPTLYLCWVDKVAITAGTWHISLRSSTGRMVAPHLPLEEFLFFLMINTVLVFASCATDRAYAILHLYTTKSAAVVHAPTHALSYMYQLTWAFFQWDQALQVRPLHDLKHTWHILRAASASFYTASAVFPCQARQDLGVLYGFCRATDDLADDADRTVEERKSLLMLVRLFVYDMFSRKTNNPDIDWSVYQDLPPQLLVSMRSFVRLRNVLEADAVNELLDGYAWDLEHRPIATEADLVHYSACVASSVGEMCTRILILSEAKRLDPATMRWTIARAREMGLALQLTNIARDIVTDSTELGRCYLPREWLSAYEYDRIIHKEARQLGDSRLRQLAIQLIDSADMLRKRASQGISRLPSECQGGVQAACEVYSAIGTVLYQANGYPTRARVSSWTRALIALKSVYGLQHVHDKRPTFKSTRQGKIRCFIA